MDDLTGESGEKGSELALIAVVAAPTGEPGPGVEWVTLRGIAAAVHRVAPESAADARGAVEEHQRWMERLLHLSSVVPAPPGIVFHSRAEVERFLEAGHEALGRALDVCADCCELRLHLSVAGGMLREDRASDLASHLYDELRRMARASTPLSHDAGRLFSAAFLVPRADRARFADRARDLGSMSPALVVEVSGPWPPYEFVRIVPD